MSVKQSETEYRDAIDSVNGRVDQIRTEYKQSLNKVQENDSQ